MLKSSATGLIALAEECYHQTEGALAISWHEPFSCGMFFAYFYGAPARLNWLNAK